MHMTIEIEEAVLRVAADLAQQRGVSIERILADFVRQGIAASTPITLRNGVPIFPMQPTGADVSLELINQLRDEAI